MSLRDALRIPAREITDEAVYRDRRRLVAGLVAAPALALSGSVRKAGSNVRVLAHLTRMSDNRMLWSQQFNRELTTDNLIDLQDEIARSIVRAIQTPNAISP